MISISIYCLIVTKSHNCLAEEDNSCCRAFLEATHDSEPYLIASRLNRYSPQLSEVAVLPKKRTWIWKDWAGKWFPAKKEEKNPKLGNRNLQWSEHIYLFKCIPRRLKPHARLWMEGCMTPKTIVFTWSSSYKRRYRVGEGFICSAAPRLRSTLFTKSTLGFKRRRRCSLSILQMLLGETRETKNSLFAVWHALLREIDVIIRRLYVLRESCYLAGSFFSFLFLFFLHTHVF